MGNFDIEEFKAVGPVILAPRPAHERRKRVAHFVPGPIPIALLLSFHLPAAFRVWAALHTRQRMKYSPWLATGFMRLLGLSKRDAQRGLAELERRGLVRVERQRGRAAVVELLPIAEPMGQNEETE